MKDQELLSLAMQHKENNLIVDTLYSDNFKTFLNPDNKLDICIKLESNECLPVLTIDQKGSLSLNIFKIYADLNSHEKQLIQDMLNSYEFYKVIVIHFDTVQTNIYYSSWQTAREVAKAIASTGYITNIARSYPSF